MTGFGADGARKRHDADYYAGVHRADGARGWLGFDGRPAHSAGQRYVTVLQFMFITTTGLYLSTLWMIFASIACLIGAGRTLGLDYYAMPAAKRGWKKLKWIKKWYLYND